MIIRRIKPDEIKRTEELFSIAFEFPYDNDKSPDDVYKDILEHQDTRDNFYWADRWAAFEDDNKTMMSYFVDKPYPVNFDGKTYQMTGIGGVSTLPQYRKSGCIRKCFEKALPEMYHNNITFSYLYPFSTAYYRKFGYELCCEKIKYRFLLSFLPSFTLKGNCYLVDKNVINIEDAFNDIKNIYSCWQNKYNMMIVNEDFEYRWIYHSNPFKDQVFTYVYKNENNEPKGYVTFSKVDEPSGRNLICNRFVYKDLEGFKGLINLLKSLASDHLYVTLELPKDQFIMALLPEWSMGAGSKSVSLSGMARVINVQTVLENATYKGSGSLSISISDQYIPENNHTFLVSFTNNKADSVIETNNCADISMNINDFSRLIIGICETEEIQFLENVKINGNMEHIQKVFYKKPNFIMEYF